MELLDLRDELRDIWLWLGDDDWLLARSHVAPAVDEPEAVADAVAEHEAPAPAPATMIVPGCVTITIGCTDAPILPIYSHIAQQITYLYLYYCW
jgi:hypothetical protein